MSEGSYVLAMYDVRGKQDFIFRTNKLKEIIGGSWLIRDIFDDYLFSEAKKVKSDENSSGSLGIFSYKKTKDKDNTNKDNTNKDNTNKGNNDFTQKGFECHIKEGYIGEVVYDGGGNFILLFKNKGTFVEVTKRFTRRIMEEIGTLRVLATFKEKVDFGDYNADSKELYRIHSLNEDQESIIAPWACIPIVQIDRKTSQPYVDYEKEAWAGREKLDDDIKHRIKMSADPTGKLTKERYAKLKKYYLEKKENNGLKDELEEEVFDKMVLQKGKDSMLAVVYIDGNSMGAKVQKATGGSKSYEECTKKLREFSEDIQNTYVYNGIANVKKAIPDEKRRFIVYAGDEINFVVNAHDAFTCARAYLKGLSRGEIDKEPSACAGIAVFNSHSPYADAYRIAEECCESGKKVMKENGLKDADFIDFHLIQGAVETSLEDIRKHEGNEITSRPWRMPRGYCSNEDCDYKPVKSSDENENGKGYYTGWHEVESLIELFRMDEFARTNVKDLAEPVKRSCNDLLMELYRIRAHQSKDNEGKKLKEGIDVYIKKLKNEATSVQTQRLIYDVVITYDMWFKKNDVIGENREEEQSEQRNA